MARKKKDVDSLDTFRENKSGFVNSSGNAGGEGDKNVPKRKYLLYLMVVVLALLALWLVVIPMTAKKSEKMEMIQDRCSLFMGNLLHQVKDEPSCRINCRNYCDTEKMDYLRVVFVEYNDKCNLCECYCR
jgi:hypothetical protein